MRILFWSDSFYPLLGGVEVLGAELVLALQERGHDLAVVARRDSAAFPAYEKVLGIPVYRFPYLGVLQSNNVGEIALQRQYIAQLKHNFRPDIVHLFQSSASAFFDLVTDRVYPTPRVVTLHGSVPTDELAPGTIRRRVLQSADWITTCSEDLLCEVRQQAEEITTYSCAIPNSLPMPALEPELPSFSPPRLLCLGRAVPQKGFDLALAAFARLIWRFPGIQLTIAGDGKDKLALEAMSQELGITDSVEFQGSVQPENVPELINSHTIIVMPSRFEPFGLVALQAAQMARPIVATRIGGLPEVVVDGETGALIENSDVDGLVTAITFLLDHPDAAVRLGQAARQRALEKFGWNEFVDAYESLYRRLLEQNRGMRS